MSNAGENKVPREVRAMHKAQHKSLHFFLQIIQLQSKLPSTWARQFPSTIRIDLLSSGHNSTNDSLARGRAINGARGIDRAFSKGLTRRSAVQKRKISGPMDRPFVEREVSEIEEDRERNSNGRSLVSRATCIPERRPIGAGSAGVKTQVVTQGKGGRLSVDSAGG